MQSDISGPHGETITVLYVMRLTAATAYSGLAIDVESHVVYFTDEGQGQVGELNVSGDDVTARSIDSESRSKPRSVAIDTVNR